MLECPFNIGIVPTGTRYIVTMETVPMGCILSLRTLLTVVLTELTNVIFIPFESDLKLLSYGQLSPGAVVTWAFVFLIRANFVAS